MFYIHLEGYNGGVLKVRKPIRVSTQVYQDVESATDPPLDFFKRLRAARHLEGVWAPKTQIDELRIAEWGTLNDDVDTTTIWKFEPPAPVETVKSALEESGIIEDYADETHLAWLRLKKGKVLHYYKVPDAQGEVQSLCDRYDLEYKLVNDSEARKCKICKEEAEELYPF